MISHHQSSATTHLSFHFGHKVLVVLDSLLLGNDWLLLTQQPTEPSSLKLCHLPLTIQLPHPSLPLHQLKVIPVSSFKSCNSDATGKYKRCELYTHIFPLGIISLIINFLYKIDMILDCAHNTVSLNFSCVKQQSHSIELNRQSLGEYSLLLKQNWLQFLFVLKATAIHNTTQHNHFTALWTLSGTT